MSTHSTTTVGPTGKSWLEPRLRIDTTWTVDRSADGSIAIVRQWHFRGGDGSAADGAEQRDRLKIVGESSGDAARPVSGVGSSAQYNSARGHHL